jgi:hypothetical protein
VEGGKNCREAKINALYVTKFMKNCLSWESDGSEDDKKTGIFYGGGIFFQSSQMSVKATQRETIIFVHSLMLYSCKGKGKVLPRTGHEGPKWE